MTIYIMSKGSGININNGQRDDNMLPIVLWEDGYLSILAQDEQWNIAFDDHFTGVAANKKLTHL